MDGSRIRIAVVFFCHDGKGNYLLNKRSQKCRDERGMWDPGGGGVEFGETLTEAVIREVGEEYGAAPKEIEFMGYRDVLRTQEGKQTHWISHDFRVLVDPSEVKNGEPEKCDALMWTTVPELETFPEPLHSQFPKFLEQHRHKLV